MLSYSSVGTALRKIRPARLGNPELAQARKERYLRRQAEQLGFTLTPVHGKGNKIVKRPAQDNVSLRPLI
jgi:hypothetical protein